MDFDKTGVYLAAAALSERGFEVAFPASVSGNADIFAMNPVTCAPFAVKIKTVRGKTPRWRLSRKNEKIMSPRIFYFFIRIAEDSSVNIHIVKSSTAAFIAKNCISSTGSCFFEDRDRIYLDNWKIL